MRKRNPDYAIGFKDGRTVRSISSDPSEEKRTARWVAKTERSVPREPGLRAYALGVARGIGR